MGGGGGRGGGGGGEPVLCFSEASRQADRQAGKRKKISLPSRKGYIYIEKKIINKGSKQGPPPPFGREVAVREGITLGVRIFLSCFLFNVM